jgi:hypothetical protein
MFDRSVNSPLQNANSSPMWVWFNGTTALLEGQAVCYEYNYNAPATPAGAPAETAASVDGRRMNYVVLPTSSNGNWFAGVCASSYQASSTGQLIQIYCPGSACNVLTNANLTIGSGVITFQCGGTKAGYFTRAGFPGAGSAIPLQTLDTSSTAGKTFCYLQEGAQSGGVELLVPPGTAGGALQSKVDGVTYYLAATNTSAVLTTTLANGTNLGERKGFVIDGTQTTNGVTVTVTSGYKRVGTALTSCTGSTAGRVATFEWGGDAWNTMGNNFDTIT